MKVEAAVLQVRRLFLDTAPLIYLFERNPTYVSVITALFRAIDEAAIVTVTSPITLSECLVVPIRLGSTQLQQRYTNQLVHGRNTVFAPIDELRAGRAAELRAQYNLRLADAFQVATAVQMNCDALLTNDDRFRRVTEINVLRVNDLEP